MSEHDTEYRELLARVARHDRDSITAHWELGELFARYGEPVTEIALAIGRSVTYVADHVRIAQVIPAREDLDRVLADRDDIQAWTVLVDWVKAGGPGQESEEEPDAPAISRQRRGGRGDQPQGGIQLVVPQSMIAGLADLGADPRDALRRFFQNVTPRMIIEMAYPDRRSPAFVSALDPQFREPASI
jgi:hypothetical protein